MLNATRRRASQDQIKSLSRHAVGSKRERKPQRAYAYYSTARNEKKGAYTMSTNEMTVDVYKIRWTKVLSNRFDSSAFKKAMPELHAQFTKQTESRRFTIA